MSGIPVSAIFHMLNEVFVELEELGLLVSICTGCTMKGEVFGAFFFGVVATSLKKPLSHQGPAHFFYRTESFPFVGYC